jgi:thiol:disulfide interchange protein DsbC
VLAVFADPNCTYCKHLEQELAKIDNVTVYTFLFPILGEDSMAKSRQIACSSDRVAAWEDWMLQGKVPSGAGTCQTAIDKTLAFGRDQKINATPTLFFADGKRIPGVVPADQLIAKMDAVRNGNGNVASADPTAPAQASIAQ